MVQRRRYYIRPLKEYRIYDPDQQEELLLLSFWYAPSFFIFFIFLNHFLSTRRWGRERELIEMAAFLFVIFFMTDEDGEFERWLESLLISPSILSTLLLIRSFCCCCCCFPPLKKKEKNIINLDFFYTHTCVYSYVKYITSRLLKKKNKSHKVSFNFICCLNLFFRDMSAGGAQEEVSCYIHTGIARDVLCVCLVVSLSGSSFRLLREKKREKLLVPTYDLLLYTLQYGRKERRKSWCGH